MTQQISNTVKLFLEVFFDDMGPNGQKFYVLLKDAHEFYHAYAIDQEFPEMANTNSFVKYYKKIMGVRRVKTVYIKGTGFRVLLGMKIREDTGLIQCKSCKRIKAPSDFNPEILQCRSVCLSCKPNPTYETRGLYSLVAPNAEGNYSNKGLKREAKKVMCLGYCNDSFVSYRGERVCPACKNRWKMYD